MTSIAVLMTPMTGHGALIAGAGLTVTLRGQKTKYYGGGDCRANAAGLECDMDCDAGVFDLARRAAGVKLIVTKELTLDPALDPAGQAIDEDIGPSVGANNSEDWTFLLPPAPAGACK